MAKFINGAGGGVWILNGIALNIVTSIYVTVSFCRWCDRAQLPMKPYQLMKVEFLVTGCFLTFSVVYFEKCDMMSLGSGTLTKY